MRLRRAFSPDLQGYLDLEQGTNGFQLQQLRQMDQFWSKGEDLSEQNLDISKFETDPCGRSLLHAAVIYGYEHIVQNLVNRRECRQLLTKQDDEGYTVLALVTKLNGNVKMAEYMVKEDPTLPSKGSGDKIPLFFGFCCRTQKINYLSFP